MNSAIELPERIFMCGFMGSGKSTVGKQMARYADVPFHDLDAKIEEDQGRSINEIFTRHGESYFRRCERQMVKQSCSAMQGVIALGGGALQDQKLVDRVCQNGLLIYLSASLTNLIPRIQDDQQRPLLLDDDGNLKSQDQLENELRERYERRQKWYQQAHITVQTDQFESADQVTEYLIDKIRNYE